MIAGTIAQLEEPAEKPLTDTTDDTSLPALAVNATQTGLDDGAVQHCTAGARVEREREEVLVYEGGITTNTVPDRMEVAADLVADVTGSGVVVVERTAGSGRYPFPLDMIAAQTGREIRQYSVDVQSFAEQWDAGAVSDTWLVGVEEDDGVTMTYNDAAMPEHAADASVGLGFALSWQGVVAEGVLYRSGYLAIYSAWTPEVFLEFVDDTVLPFAFAEDDDSTQTTL